MIIGFKLLFLGIIRVFLGVRLNMYKDRINIEHWILQLLLFQEVFMVCNYEPVTCDSMIVKGFASEAGRKRLLNTYKSL